MGRVHADVALTFTSHVCCIVVFLVFPRLIQQLVYTAFLESDLPASQSLCSSSPLTRKLGCESSRRRRRRDVTYRQTLLVVLE